MAYSAGTAAPPHRPPAPSARRSSAATWAEDKIQVAESKWPWILATLMLIDAVLLLYMGRGLTFYYDEWNFVTQDFGGGIHSLLLPHVGNISVFPIAVYKVLFHIAGLNHYAVYRLVLISLHLLSAGLIFVLASRRIPRVPALLAMALVLFLGAAWEDLLWAFQIGYMLSIAGGLAAWVLVEREDRLGDLGAMLCLIVAAGSSSLGIPVMVGIVVELAWQRHWRRGWLVAVPAVLYLMWYAGYGESQVTAESLIHAPGFVADLAAAAFGGLIGRALEWGRPLALLGLVVVVRRLLRPAPITPRLAGLLATGVSLWIVTAAARSTISVPETGRYMYLGAVVLVLVGVEFLRGVTIAPRAVAVATLLVAFCAVTGLTALHAGSVGLRTTSKTVAAELGAMEIAAAYVPPSYQPDPQLAPQITAGPYLHTVRAMGSSAADTPSEIIASEPAIRTEVDSDLIKLEGGALIPAGPAQRLNSRLPLVANVSGSNPIRGTHCWSTAAIGPGTYTEFLLPPHGLIVRATSRPVQVVARRFAPLLGGVELGSVAPAARSLVRFPVDTSGRPWFVRLASGSPSLVCGLG